MPSTTKKKTQRWCFVPGCDGGYKGCADKVSLFRAPSNREMFEKWARAIPRADKPLEENSAVCEKHFDERFVVRAFKHQVNGQEVLIPHDIPTLTEDAFPTVFPNLPKYISKTLPKARKRRITTSLHAVPAKANCSSQNEVSPSGSGELDGTQEHHHEELNGSEVPAKTHQCPHRETLAVPARGDFAHHLRCPSHHWYKQTLESGSVVSYQTTVFDKTKTPPVELSKVVVFEHESTRPSVRCSIFFSGLLHKVKNVESEEAQEALNYTEDTSLCVGIGGTTEFQLLDQKFKGIASRQQLFSKHCDGSAPTGTGGSRCLSCKYSRNLLMTRLRRMKKQPAHPVSVLKQRLRQAVRRLRRRNKKVLSLLDRLKLLQEKNVSITEGALEAQVRLRKVYCMLSLQFPQTGLVCV
ncbi:uncharacterized protein LOC121836558 [Ixodes scapularis]|uniref:uncharacterized protein LOC121836558 n=1 Tax=Ixodes scapularis TaxID=6945 RepID=UPI001C381455|nr:uncharacterized protein LOC121836558 [Ixodes scapularis]